MTKNEDKVLKFIREHSDIYTVTREGKLPRKQLKETKLGESLTGEAAEGFLIRDLLEHSDFPALGEISERTLRNILTGLVRKQRISLLRASKSANVYGKILSDNIKALEKDLLPEISPFSTDFLCRQVGNILYGKSVQTLEEQAVPKSLIETFRHADLKITPEIVVFSPEWHYSDLFMSENGSEKNGMEIQKLVAPALPGQGSPTLPSSSDEALEGRTPAEVCGIEVKGENKWITLIQNAKR